MIFLPNKEVIVMEKCDYEITVFKSKETCFECNDILEMNDFITYDRTGNVLCLSCGDLDHLVYLPSGNHALTRRARKHSTLSAIVYKFSSARKRNERQGIFVEKNAIELAEDDCLADSEIRERRRERDSIRRELLDEQYVNKFAKHIRDYYPSIPQGIEIEIAEHSCLKNSGRVGRTADAKQFSQYTIDLAVRAHIRHSETDYHQLLAKGALPHVK